MGDTGFFWGGLEPLLRIIVVGTLAYISIVVIIRITGKRTLAKMNSFDFIITVAIGAAYGRVLTARSVTISEAITAFAVLAVLQVVFSHFEVTSKSFRKIISPPPRMLYYKNEFIEKNLRKERVVKRDIIGELRKQGYGSLDEVEAIILESDGTVSIIKKSGAKSFSTFEDLSK